MQRAVTLAGGLLALFLLPAAAPTATPEWIDRKAPTEHPAVAEALKSAVGMPQVPESVIRRIGPVLYSDNQLTPGESDLILELLDNKTTKVRITTAAGESFDVPPLSTAARDMLSLHDIPDLQVLWLAGPKEMKSLVDVTILNPRVVPQMELFFGNNLFTSWSTAQRIKDQSYFTRTLNAAVSQFRLAGPETERRGRALLYGAMIRVDRANRGVIPDNLYMYLRPAPANPT
jgi:hypothetical protein